MKSCGMTFTNDGACYCVGEAIDFSVLLQSLASHSSAETAIPEAK